VATFREKPVDMESLWRYLNIKLLNRDAMMSKSTSKYSESQQTALAAYTKLMRAAESVTTRTNRAMATAGLTISQFGVLEALLHKGPLCQRDIGAKILKSSGNMTMVIDNLEKRGLVRRERDIQDRRYFTVYLTEEGQALIEEVFPQVMSGIVEEMSVLEQTEQEELGRLCRILGTKERRGK
jgi:MarR family transcriptional regulator, 2-MHQ and catechol-resistance regulon repressor